MPTILTLGPYRFYFYPYDCTEPPHIHVDSGNATAKFWLKPIKLFRQKGFKNHELGDIERLIKANHKALLKAWDDFCKGAKP